MPPVNLDLTALPDDIKGAPSLQSFKTVDDLAKSYISSQHLIGQNRLPAPADNWTDQQWGELYGKLGRPEKPDGYAMPTDVTLHEGFKIDDAKRVAAFTEFHKLGLTKKQAEGVMRYYIGAMNSVAGEEDARRQTSFANGQAALKTAYGDKYDAVVQSAKNVLAKIGSPDFIKYLDETGLANDPEMVGFLFKVSQGISEDRLRSGGQNINPSLDAGQALAEITRLETDEGFQKAYHDRTHPDHESAVQRILMLNGLAYPGKVTG